MLFVGVVMLVAVVEEVGGGSGGGSTGGLGPGCIVTNFNVELCGQDAIDHCESWRENQQQIQDDAAESAQDARRLNRQAKRDARRYGGNARDYGYDPDAEEEAYQLADDGFTRKTDEICAEILGEPGLSGAP